MQAQDDSRTRILKASLALFGAKGYSETTTREIAELSGLSEGTLFNHFKDKPSIYEQVIADHVDKPVEELEAADKKIRFEDLGEDLYQLTTSYIEAIFSHLHILRILMREKTSAEPRTDQLRLAMLIKLVEHLKAYLARAADRGLIADKDYTIPADLFICHLTRLVLFDAASERTFTLTAKMKKSLLKRAAEQCPKIAMELFAPAPERRKPEAAAAGRDSLGL